MSRRALVALLALAAPADAADIVSPAPEAISVTIYRDPDRSSGGTIDLDDLTGFALITETRTVSLPAGETIVRFEGVADGILPVSAVVAGLPEGVVEKNRDARLLTPSALIDASLGRSVQLIRTNPATGKPRVVDAVVRSGPDGGVLFETSDGVEALRCSGLPERLVFAEVPAGLSAKPTLSVLTRSARPVTATVTLAYLARGFDWSASYVARVRPDGRTLDLTGWVTLANGNTTGFPDAGTQVVAGRLNRDEDSADDAPEPWDGRLFAQCWPWDSTSTYPRWALPTLTPPPPPPPLAAPDVIIVTAQRVQAQSLTSPVSIAQQEELGDLKLYRVPETTTVAARGQKQVLLLEQQAVPFERIHRFRLWAGDKQEPESATILMRVRNEKRNNLGLPLPTGAVAVFEQAGGRPMLAGEDSVRDTAVGELLEIEVGRSPDVRVAVAATDDHGKRYDITVTNARAEPVTTEIMLNHNVDETIIAASPRFVLKDGKPTWTTTVPANGQRTLRYRVRTTD